MVDYRQHVTGAPFVTDATQYMRQLRGAEVMMEKIKAAIIMQAWIDGYYVTEFMDEILIEKEEPCP